MQSTRDIVAALQRDAKSVAWDGAPETPHLAESADRTARLLHISSQEAHEKLLAHRRAILARLHPAPFENPEQFFALGSVWLDVLSAAQQRGFQTDLQPILATATTGTVNAYAIRGPDDDTAIVLDRRMVRMLHTLAIVLAIATVTPIDRKDGELCIDYDVVKGRASFRRARREAATLFGLNALRGDWRAHDLSHFHPAVIAFSQMFYAALMSFVLGHELAHILCGHLKKTRLLRAIGSEERVNAVVRSQTQETEADFLAMELSSAALHARGLPIPISLSGGFLFCVAVWLLDTAVQVLERGKPLPPSVQRMWAETGGSHPHPARRSVQLLRAMQAGRSSVDDKMELERLHDDMQNLVVDLVGPLTSLIQREWRRIGAPSAPYWSLTS